MSLEVKLHEILKLRGKADRFCTLTFRGIPLNSIVLSGITKDACFSEDFVWPLETLLDEGEYLEVKLFSRNKVFQDRVVGAYRFSLGSIWQGGMAEVCDKMIDSAHNVLQTEIKMDVMYTPPEVDRAYYDLDMKSESVYISMPSIAPSEPKAESVVVAPSVVGSVVRSLSEPPKAESIVGSLAGSKVGSVVGSKVESVVGSIVGSVVGSKVGSKLGSKFGSKSKLGSKFGSQLISEIGSVSSYQGSQAAMDLVTEVGEVFEDVDIMEKGDDFYHPKLKPPKVINVTVGDWIMNVRVIEARDLAGQNLNPYCVVTVDGDLDTQKITKVIKAQSNPEWDEQFVFDYKLTKDQALDQVIVFEVFTKGGMFSEDKLIGMFKCDLWYIYDSPDSALFARYAPLLDAFTFEMKGYLRLDLQVFTRGDVVKDAPPRKEDAEIEQNLILPPKINPYRSVNQYQLKIYAAEGIPKMASSWAYMANVRSAITKKAIDQADPFIRVTFAGVTAETKVMKNTYAPKFDEQISFTEFFPPLCKRIKIELYDKDFNGEEIIGTTYIDLSQISNPGDLKRGGFMPTMGPSWIHLYGGIRDYGSKEEFVLLSKGVGEGVAYRGRILLWLEVIESEPSDVGVVEVDDCKGLPPKILGREESYQLFATFFEASMIPRKIGGKPLGGGRKVQFEVAIGEYGFVTQDEAAKARREYRAERAKEIGREIIRRHVDKEEIDESKIYCDNKVYLNSVTPPLTAVDSNRKYYHVPFGGDKPNVHIKFPMEDQRRRHYNSILLRKIEALLEENLEELDERVRLRYPKTHKVLKRTLGEVVHNCILYIDLTDGKKTGTHLGKNRLDQERDKLCSVEIKQISLTAANIAKTLDTMDNIEEKIKKTRTLYNKIKKLVREPQCGLPDIFIWMIVDDKRVAYARLPAEDFLYSQVPTERGDMCGRAHTIYLRLPGKQGHGQAGWFILAKVEIRIWLGLQKQKSEYLKDAPGGYILEEHACSRLHVPPPYLHYVVKQKFILRAHIYQARGLIGSDDSGLSDAFLRCVFANMPQDTYVVWENRSPTWDVMLKYEDLVLWGDVAEFSVNPPTIVLEFFDMDPNGDTEFIGRALANPIIKLADEKYEKPLFPPALQWFPIYRGEASGGDLLAAFELLHVDDDVATVLPDDPPYTEHEQGPIMRIPEEVRPVLQKHRVEILFWGVRDISNVNFMKVNRPMVELDCCYKIERLEEPDHEMEVLSSTIITNTQKNPNFYDSVDVFDVWMPEKEKYLPPMQIKVLDCRAFGQKVLCGTSVIETLWPYFMDPNLFESRVKEEPVAGKRAGAEDPGGDDVPPPEEEPPPKEEKKKKPGEEAAEEEVLDWWTRFYATLRDLEDAEEERRIAELAAAGVVIKKKKKLPFNLPGKKSDDDDDEEGGSAKPGADIPRITLYLDKLENIPEFKGFNDFLMSYDLMRGKRIDDDDDADFRRRYSGKYKGNVRVWEYPLPDGFEKLDELGSFYKLPSHDPFEIMVRVYIIRAFNVHPMDSDGKADPYIICHIGNKTSSRRKEYCPKTLEPEFGQCHEMKALIPFDYKVKVQLMDHDMLGSDDLIGETTVDIENLFFSKHRPRCGIQTNYVPHGYAAWRDPAKPSAILSKLCNEFYIDGPTFAEEEDEEGNTTAVCTVGDVEFRAPPFFLDEGGKEKTSDEPVALEALKNFDQLAPKGFKLCPEYVETRPLFHPDKPGLEMGKVQMWIDMFQMDLALPGDPVDISVRKPDEYELRVIIWNTEDVLCNETNLMGQLTSDTYVKVWLEGMEESRQKTDVHYSARDGTGLFNWRMLFPFKFHKAEEKFVTYKKDSFFSVDLTMKRHKPLIYIQVWDADLFTPDDFVGEAIMRLTRLPAGASEAKACNLKMFGPNYHTVNFFKTKMCKGWWPVQCEDYSDDPKLDKNGRPEKILAGKVEIEFDLKTQEEAEANPVGKKRAEPEPLDDPGRPSRFQFYGPLTLLRYMVWEPCKWNLLKCIICLLILLLLALFLYSAPGYTIKKIMGA